MEIKPMKQKRVQEIIDILSRQHEKERLKVMSKIHAKYIIQVTGLSTTSYIELEELRERGFAYVVHGTIGDEEEQDGLLKLHIVDTTNKRTHINRL